jgi:hypothetical protein
MLHSRGIQQTVSSSEKDALLYHADYDSECDFCSMSNTELNQEQKPLPQFAEF